VHICYRTPGVDDIAQMRFDSAGLITRETLQRLLPLDDYDVYLCGPPPFMQANWRLLRSLGVDRSRIHYEFFGPATVLGEDCEQPVPPVDATLVTAATPASPASQPAEAGPLVVIEPPGRAFAWDASCHSLLDFCEQAGFAPSFSCRAGVCGTCSTKLVAGEVMYFDLPLDPPPDGEILLCCTRPVTPVRLQLMHSNQGRASEPPSISTR
jgi:ferredoxin